MRIALAGMGAGAVATGVGLLLAVTAPAAPPVLTLEAADAEIGQSIQATATLSESPGAEGEISFEVFGPDDPTCAGTALATPTAAVVNGEGQYSSGTYSPPTAGTYRWSAHYSGDTVNEPVDSTCSALSTVSKASPSLTGDASSATVGSAIHDEVTLDGGFSPGGEVSFSVYAPSDTTCSTPLETFVATVEGGAAESPGYTTQQAGQYRWTASYGGDADNEGAALGCNAANQTSSVAKASPGLSGQASDGTVGGAIHDEVTVTGGFSPGGEVSFSVFAPGDSSCSTALETFTVAIQSGAAKTPDYVPQQAGQYRWTASYGGDADNEGAALGCNAANQTSSVAKASPTLSGSASPSVTVGQTITDSVTLSGGFQAGGELVFRAYGPGNATCTGSPAYEASVSVAGAGPYSPTGFSPGPGTYRWTVSYGGDANNETAVLACNSANQSSSVAKATPALSGTASSAVIVGQTITDHVTLSGGFEAGGELVFRAYGPEDKTCAETPVYEEPVAVDGAGSYAPAGFAPAPGLYRWTVSYGGDADNEPVALACNTEGQASAVGTVTVTFTAAATAATVGQPVTATATISEGAIPSGQIVFNAFPPSDPTCSGSPAFTSTVKVAGNGTYASAPFVPSKVGSYRWTVAYSGDPSHAPAAVACGSATSTVSQAAPSILGWVSKKKVLVGKSVEAVAGLDGAFSPGGTITFRIFAPGTADCASPLLAQTVTVSGAGPFKSAPYVPSRTGTYTFLAGYSGDAGNRAAREPCGSALQRLEVLKRSVQVKPRARVTEKRRISILARLSKTFSPSGRLEFRLYKPGDRLCKRKPAFSGRIAVKRNGSYSLAEYLATRHGTYHLAVGYSGDARNKPYAASCKRAQAVPVA